MKTVKPLGYRAGRTGRSVPLLVLVSAAIVFGVVAIRRRSRTAQGRRPDQGQQASGAAESALVGHEFSFRLSGRRHRMRVLGSARHTEDGSLRGEYFAAPRASAPVHAHRHQEERFEVLSGTLGVRVGGRELLLGPGQSAVGPPGVPHE